MEVKSAGCPLGAKCEEVRDVNSEQIMFRCEWYIHLRGKHPQKDGEIDEWGCSISWIPILLIENAQQSRQTGAAVEDFRNKMLESQDTLYELTSNAKKQISDR